MANMSFLEAIAKNFVDSMPNNRMKQLHKYPEEKQKEFIGECFDLMKDYIKAKFIDFAMEELKRSEKK